MGQCNLVCVCVCVRVCVCVCGASLDDWANGGSVDAFFTYGMVLVLWGVLLQGMGMGFTDRIKLHCFTEVKCQRGYTARI